MSTPPPTDKHVEDGWVTTHPLAPGDAVAMTALRSQVAPNKGRMRGAEARGAFDAIMGQVAPPDGVSYAAGMVGDVPGWWCIPIDAAVGRALLHCHGGWFNWGSAETFRSLVGHIAKKAKTRAFIPDYRLAPEHRFPAALDDVRAAYDGMVDLEHRKIVVLGDSAGGNLALSLLAILADRSRTDIVRPSGAVVLSPVTDLTLTGASWETREDADPYFTKPQAASLVQAYLGGHDPADPAASPLFATLTGLPPVRVHVGDDEMLLDDSTRYVARAVASGVDANLHIWKGMPHGFLGGIGRLEAAGKMLDAIGAFVTERLNNGNESPA